MAKDVINVGGEDKVVREDTAKSFRGTNWALVSIGGIILILALLLLGFFLKSATNDQPTQSPGQIEKKRQ